MAVRQLPACTALGGGHGLSAMLTALRHCTDRLTAIVTVADDGGSSGRIREQFDMLPPGDLRMALAALCGDDPEGRMWAEVMQARFDGNGELGGHAIGNLLIAGLWQQLEDPVAGLDMVARLLKCCGRVLPMSVVPLELQADVIGADQFAPDEITTLRGQVTVAETTAEVRQVRVIPEKPPACVAAIEAISESDFVFLGPGSWFSSVIPHLLIPEQLAALATTSAKKVLCLNLESYEETENFTAARHIEVLAEHAPMLRWDYVIADNRYVESERYLDPYAASLGADLVFADVGVRDGSPRHDSLRLAATLSEIMQL
ncbi:MAG: gluconeogenesis factor YvcK family protein [Propionibacteriaceae bacterium]